MLADSGLLRDLEQHAFSTTREPMALYGDPAYPLRVHLQVPYRGAGITPQMEVYNKAMSAVRMSVEWIFGDIVNYFKFLDFKKFLAQQRVSLSNSTLTDFESGELKAVQIVCNFFPDLTSRNASFLVLKGFKY